MAAARAGAAARTEPGLARDGTLPDDPLLHVCVLTFASDMTLLDTVLARHGLAVAADSVAMASLDHAMWFERPFRADDWCSTSPAPPRPPVTGAGLRPALTRSGVQVASVVQEGMIRVRGR